MNEKQKQTLLNYFCQCSNEKINVISEIRDFRQNDMVNVVARANLAQQLILFQQNIDEAYELINDLIGLESQNVKCVMHTAARNFQVFEILGIQKQCQLLVDIANNYQIPDCAVHLLFAQPFQEQMKETAQIKNQRIRYLCRCHLTFILENPDPEIEQLNEILKFTRFFIMDSKIIINDDTNFFLRAEFNRLQKSEFHEIGFSQFNKRNTLNLIKKQEFTNINQKIIDHFTVEITVYKLIASSNFQLSFISSIQIIRFNMLLLSLLYKYNCEIDLSFQHNDMENDPQQIFPYLLQILTLLIQLNQEKIILKVLSLIHTLKFSKIEDMQKVNDSANLLLKQQPNQQIIDSLLPIFKRYTFEIYHKFAIFSNQQIDLSTFSKEKSVHNLITSIFIKQDKDYLAANFDKLYMNQCVMLTLIIPEETFVNFLNQYDQKFLQTKMTEYFSYSQEDLNSTLLMISQQLEIDVNIKQPQSLSFEYISIISKLLHLILVICQNPKNKNLYMEYFSMQMQFINNFDKKLPKESDYKYNGKLVNSPLYNEIVVLKKAKTLLLNLSMIERVYKLHKIDNRQILLLKLSILSYHESVPEYLLLQLSKSQQHFKDLKKQYPKAQEIKEINFYAKIEKLKKNLGSDIKIKSQLKYNYWNNQCLNSLVLYLNFKKNQNIKMNYSNNQIFIYLRQNIKNLYRFIQEMVNYVHQRYSQIIEQRRFMFIYKYVTNYQNVQNTQVFIKQQIQFQIKQFYFRKELQELQFQQIYILEYLVKMLDNHYIVKEEVNGLNQKNHMLNQFNVLTRTIYQKVNFIELFLILLQNIYVYQTIQILICMTNYYQNKQDHLSQKPTALSQNNCLKVQMLNNIVFKLMKIVDMNQFFDQVILEQIIPVLVLGLCEQQISQNICNYGYQMFILVQNQLAQTLHSNIDQSKLYMYLYLRLKEFLTYSQPQFISQIQCKCPQQKKYDKNKLEFDLIATLASFQMNQKRILLQQEDISIMKCENIGRTSELAKTLLQQISLNSMVKKSYQFLNIVILHNNLLINRLIQSINVYNLKMLQQNIDCLDESSCAPGQWWSKRDYYEQQLLKRQLSIEYALQEHIDFIYKSDSPLLILSPQLQLLPWDHIKNTVFNRIQIIYQQIQNKIYFMFQIQEMIYKNQKRKFYPYQNTIIQKELQEKN
ncbi:unnamed protein product [Paramecium sonneborni]|uniref:Uncharacterized protein n=1 Tax=Paramecium sonneborni TaxID=65129 RepID=A0A8S1KHL9_9CILI|nr:unnamed protein product [Paramecium sonneborni]